MCEAEIKTDHQILPPLRDATHRPEEGSTVKSRLIRLMTHLDTDVKHCAADFLFVLCKENGKSRHHYFSLGMYSAFIMILFLKIWVKMFFF